MALLIKNLSSLRSIVGRAFSTASAGGLNFGLSDDQQALKDLADKFALHEILPVAAHHDRTGEYPWALIKRSHELGLINSHIPEA